MKTEVITIPKEEGGHWEAIADFLTCVHKALEQDIDKVVFDLSALDSFIPSIIGGLAALYRVLTEKGCLVEFIMPKAESLAKHRGMLNFPYGFDFDGSSHEHINRSLMEFHKESCLPVIFFPTSFADAAMREKIITAINTVLRNQVKASSTIVQAITYILDELTQNIVDHSGSQQGLVVAQYYPDEQCVELCIADWGKGIYQSYIDSGKFKPEDNVKALEFAVKGKSTKNLPESRGFGLSTSRNMLVNGLGGEFFMLSGDTFFIELPHNIEDLVQAAGSLRYKGCYVSMKIPLNKADSFDFYKFVE